MAKEKCQSVSEACWLSQSEAPGTSQESLLSPHRAFVVQFRTETATAQGHFAGRVEHIVSGHATRFHSPEELVAFIRRILTTVRE